MTGEHPCLYSDCPHYRGGVKRDDDGRAIKIYCAYPSNLGKRMLKVDPSECICNKKGGYRDVLKNIEWNLQHPF